MEQMKSTRQQAKLDTASTDKKHGARGFNSLRTRGEAAASVHGKGEAGLGGAVGSAVFADTMYWEARGSTCSLEVAFIGSCISSFFPHTIHSANYSVGRCITASLVTVCYCAIL